MRSVAVIGSGPSGLAAAKALVEHGLDPVVFEGADAIGGMWSGPGRGAWSSCARTNLSCFSCAFSDFPWPEGCDVFPRRDAIIGYLRHYAETFGLMSRICLGTRVESVEPEGEHRWLVTSRDSGEKPETSVFDWVVVASGVFSRPFIPHFEGLSRFRGRVHHSSDCSSGEEIHARFDGARVLVVGTAFSGTEIAALLAPVAASVTVGFRNPMWFLPRWVRLSEGGPSYPVDMVLYNRKPSNPLNVNPRRALLDLGGDPGAVSPELAFDDIDSAPLNVVTAEGFLSLVADGKIAVKRSGSFAFDEDGVIYADGTRQDLDAVVMCTGFIAGLPFFGQPLLNILEFDPADQLQPLLLHKQVFHPELPGLCFVGYYRGPYFPVMELQGRWVARVAAGEIPPPHVDDQLVGVEAERKIRYRRPRPQFPHGDYVRLADDLAREVGVFPEGDEVGDLERHLREGPLLSAHYRLVGPHARPELARQTIQAAPAPHLEGKA